VQHEYEAFFLQTGVQLILEYLALLRYISHFFIYSVFGEDALVNVSVEKKDDNGKLAGYIRIRSKTQGIALSLGDRITSVQRAEQVKQ
jgi:Coatomer beta subunit appendage platform